ncbi:MAG: alpha-ketoglutarate-dependent dioxygenase AlkB [Burkholderiales bacterium]|nr:alpha-ketoglutarate-dependent dioxygenase AlkB [Burkholderiales bacterium]
MAQQSLFLSDSESEDIQLEDAHLRYFPHFLDEKKADLALQQLLSETAWRQEEIRIAGIARKQPRLSAWLGDPNAHYSYSGLHLAPSPWTPTILQLRREIQDLCLCTFNSVLLNLYRDQQDAMGWHSDDEKELGSQPNIASLSLGASRQFLLKHKTKKDQRYSMALQHGSLLLMSGNTQSHWLHSIARETTPCAARINLTFRHII